MAEVPPNDIRVLLKVLNVDTPDPPISSRDVIHDIIIPKITQLRLGEDSNLGAELRDYIDTLRDRADSHFNNYEDGSTLDANFADAFNETANDLKKILIECDDPFDTKEENEAYYEGVQFGRTQDVSNVSIMISYAEDVSKYEEDDTHGAFVVGACSQHNPES